MSKRRYPGVNPGRGGSYVFRHGQSAVELAFAAPILVMLLLLIVDFGRFYYITIAVVSAARAGAQYGSQTLATAADNTGMANAAKTDWNNSSLALTVTPAQCTCVSSTNVTACTPTPDFCADDAQATFVQVKTKVTITAVMTYLGIPTSVMSFIGVPTTGVLSNVATMQVQQ